MAVNAGSESLWSCRQVSVKGATEPISSLCFPLPILSTLQLLSLLKSQLQFLSLHTVKSQGQVRPVQMYTAVPNADWPRDSKLYTYRLLDIPVSFNQFQCL